MLVYESETTTREKLEQIRKQNICAICGEWLSMFLDPESHSAFIACHHWTDTHHEGIAKENREPRELNIPTKRSEMAEQIGTEKASQLIKYQGVMSLTRPQAMEIMETIWPDAPAMDKVAAAILCSSYGLNPLANHVFLIPFKDKMGKKTWARVWGIKAKRLLASRKGGYSYLDMTPRLMTEDEQVKVWGAVDTANLCYMTWLKDMKTGAEVYGYGKWPKNQEPYGTDKGNTKANMASIRSESQAIDRLRPAEMPSGWTATDETYIEGEGRVIDTATGEITEQATKSEPLPDNAGLVSSPVKTAGDDFLGEQVADLAEQVKEKLEKDETFITKEQLKHITELLEANKMGATDLGKWMVERKWDIPKKMPEIKVWQYNEICLAFEKGKP